MELSKKVKIALDETRILILGVQILLGFQLRGVFSDGYEQLPTYLRYLDGLALGLLVCVVGLLITPGPYHRIVESGEDSAHILRLVTVIANLSLFPFALALGLDVFITAGLEQLPGPSKIIHAASIFLVALAVVLLMAPAAYHRIVYAGEDTQEMHRVGSILVTVATVPLALGLAGDIYVVMAKIAGSPIAGLVAGVLGLIVLIGLWHAYPLAAAYIRNRADR